MPRLIPDFSFTLQMSDELYGLIYQQRTWNKYVRVALTEEMEKHHRERIPLHFRLAAHGTYGYQERKESTKRKKRFYWRKPPGLDLVRTGLTARTIMGYRQITFAGSFGGPNSAAAGLQGRLIMRLPFPASRDSKRPGSVNIEQMKREITSTTDAEQQAIAMGVGMRIQRQFYQGHGPLRTVYRTASRGG